MLSQGGEVGIVLVAELSEDPQGLGYFSGLTG